MSAEQGTWVSVTGTGCPIPDAKRAGPGVLVRCDELCLQFDAGRGTVARLSGLGVTPAQLDAVFITHHHSDHLLGLADVLLTRWIMDRDDSIGVIDVVAPAGPAVDFCSRVLDIYDLDIQERIEHNKRSQLPQNNIVSFDAESHLVPVWRAETRRGSVVVESILVHHEPIVPTVGYRITTPDGVVAITGDTVVCDEVRELAEGADVVVYEALRFSAFEGLGQNRRFILDYHADTKLIGQQVKDLDVATLMLTHLIPPPNTEEEKEAFASEVRAGGYTGELIVSDDLDTVKIGSL